jgi:hypothetical protein
MWSRLGRRNLNPTQSLKITYGLILLGAGYVFMVYAGSVSVDGVKVGIFWLTAAYFLHTTGELCLSPTGLSFVTKASPVRWVAFLMGLWFLSNFVANLGGGIVAGYIKDIEAGQVVVAAASDQNIAVLDRKSGEGEFELIGLTDEGTRLIEALDIRTDIRDREMLQVEDENSEMVAPQIEVTMPLADILPEGAAEFSDDPAPDLQFTARNGEVYEVDLSGVETFGNLRTRISEHTGKIRLFWYDWFQFGGSGDFFLLFVISSWAAALLALILTPLYRRLLHGVE